MKILPIIFALVLLTGCQLPRADKAEYMFQDKHPGAVVLGVSEQITNRWDAQIHFYYKNAGDDREHEDIWYYHHPAEGWVADEQKTVR
jgi:hypothetical protein